LSLGEHAIHPDDPTVIATPYYVGKPFDSDALLALIARALAERTPPRPAP
jgi:hypothetical protein